MKGGKRDHRQGKGWPCWWERNYVGENGTWRKKLCNQEGGKRGNILEGMKPFLGKTQSERKRKPFLGRSQNKTVKRRRRRRRRSVQGRGGRKGREEEEEEEEEIKK